MIKKCECGSYAINPKHHGREEGVDLHLCDVCYWRARSSETLTEHIKKLDMLLDDIDRKMMSSEGIDNVKEYWHELIQDRRK